MDNKTIQFESEKIDVEKNYIAHTRDKDAEIFILKVGVRVMINSWVGLAARGTVLSARPNANFPQELGPSFRRAG